MSNSTNENKVHGHGGILAIAIAVLVGIVAVVALLIYFPSEKVKTTSYKSEEVSFTCTGTSAKKHCNVILGENLRTVHKYSELIRLLGEAGKFDTFNIYIVGNGGYVRTALALHYAIRKSPGRTTTITVGDVYSGHAMLAISGKRVVVQNINAIFMFHRSSGYSRVDKKSYCQERYTGQTDRRQSMVAKCIDYLNAYEDQDRLATKMIYKDALTEKQIARVLEGHDVFVNASEISSRFKTHKISVYQHGDYSFVQERRAHNVKKAAKK
jgi:ATP-dependent protease ClpP protease subunit